MFTFLHPEYLYLLLLLPLILLLYVYGVRTTRHHLKKLGRKEALEALMPERSAVRGHIRFLVIFLIVGLTVILLARPQYGVSQRTDTVKGIEAVVMVDVSNSMLATDVQPSRLDRAKLFISTLLKKMQNDKIAMGVFAGEAYPQLPITSDYSSVQLFVDALSTDMVSLQGTNVEAAVKLAEKSFTDSEDVGKAIILITDGENHEGNAEEAAREAAKKGYNIIVVGVGTQQGGNISTPQGLLTDENGNAVVTALNEGMCRQIAQAGKGIYLHLDQTNSAQKEIQSQLSRLKQSSSTVSYTARDEQFQAIALLIVVLLIIEVCISETRNSVFKKFRFFAK